MRKICIRFDDICPAMDYNKFNLAVNKLDNFGIKPLLGIVPLCNDPELMFEPSHIDFWEQMRKLKLKGYLIAMHGVTHVYDSSGKGILNRGKSEFVGHSYEEQFNKIKRGKEVMKAEGLDTDIFFAPSHSYDNNTLKALYDNGFKYVSDGKSNKPYVSHGIKAIPCIHGGLLRSGRIRKRGIYTAVIHTSEWVAKNQNAESLFIKFCDKYSSEIVDFSDVLNEKCGNYYLQKIIEKINVIYLSKIRPNIAKAVCKIIKK